MKNLFKKLALVTTGAVVAGQSMAAGSGVDLTPLTSAFTAADIVTGVLAVAVVLMTVYVAIKAVKIVISMVRG